MLTQLTNTEIAVARAVQGDIPICERPFHAIARDIGRDEQEILDTIQELQKRGVIRKFGAIVRHGQAGYRANIMVVWAVPPAACDAIGTLFASFPAVSHCYRREPPLYGRYRIFTMMHSRHGEASLYDLMEEMSRQSGITDYLALPSREEFKKTSMEYF